MGRPLHPCLVLQKDYYPIGILCIPENIFSRIGEFLLAYTFVRWKYMYSLIGQRSNNTVDHQRIGICLGQSVKITTQSCPESIRAFVNVFASFILIWCAFSRWRYVLLLYGKERVDDGVCSYDYVGIEIGRSCPQ